MLSKVKLVKYIDFYKMSNFLQTCFIIMYWLLRYQRQEKTLPYTFYAHYFIIGKKSAAIKNRVIF